VGTRVINASRDNTLTTLRALKPIFDQLVRAGDDLPRALDFMLTYPFPPGAIGAVSGDFVRLHVTVDLNGAQILANLLVAPPSAAPPTTPALPTVPALPGLPAVPGVTAPLPPLPGQPPPPSPPPSGDDCGLLGILTGCK
jgi:phospholipid/cholesterol/gamma-HCH transport system substrate-binding protein